MEVPFPVCVYDRFILMAAVYTATNVYYIQALLTQSLFPAEGETRSYMNEGGEITAELSNCVSTGELLRNKARPFVFGATPALSLPVHFMLSSHFFPLQKTSKCVPIYLPMFTKDI